VYADLDQKFAGSLAETTLGGRQIHALERLADQSDDLPNAVRDLSQVASRLPTLEDTIAERHREIMQVIRDAVEQSAADIRKSLADGVQTAVTDQKGWMDTLVHRADELLTERAAGFAERLERDAEARAQAEEQRLAALHDAEQRRVGELRDHLERLSTSQMEWLSSFERRVADWRTAEEERITKAWTRDAEERRSQAERDASRWSAWQTHEEERAAALREQMEKISLDEERRGRQATDALVASTELASGLMGQLQDAVAKLVVLDEEARAARRSELEAMRTESARWLERADERNTAEQERWQTWVETLQSQYAGLESTAAARVEELTQLLGLMMQEQRAATEATLAKTSSAVEQMDAHASERLRELAERIGQMADARLADERALELELRQSRQQAAEGLAASLQRYADEIRSELSAATLALRDGADAIAGGGVELMALADRFADAVTAYRSANDSWLDRLAHWETQKIEGDTGQLDAEMGAYLDQTREVFDRSLDMQRELFAGLRGMRIEEHTEPHVEEEALTGASSPTLRARPAAHQALPFDPGAGEPTRIAGPLPVDDDLPAQSAPSSDRERADVVTRRHDEADTPDAELAKVEPAAEKVPEPGGEPANPESERATDEVPELGSEPIDGARAPDDTRKRKRSAKKKSPESAQHAESAHEVTPESKAAPSASADVEVS
jgi:hypothetical protein